MTFLWGYKMDEQARKRVEGHLLQVPTPVAEPDWKEVARGLVGKCAVPLEVLQMVEHDQPWLSPELRASISEACIELRQAASLLGGATR